MTNLIIIESSQTGKDSTTVVVLYSLIKSYPTSCCVPFHTSNLFRTFHMLTHCLGDLLAYVCALEWQF